MTIQSTARPKIIIDFSKLNNPNCGLGQISLAIAKELTSKASQFNLHYYLPSEYFHSFGENVNYVSSNSWIQRLNLLPQDNFNIVHSLYQRARYLPANYSNHLLTIHDLNFLFEKQGGKRQKSLDAIQEEVYQADALTFISHYTKKICQNYLHIPQKRQAVIYNGVYIDTEKNVQKPSYLQPNQSFLFSIGEFRAKKNFDVLIDFIKQLPISITLVIAGDNRTSYGSYIVKKIKKASLENRVYLPGIISEHEKIYLYRHCLAFVFPSLYEGFGLPVIEAMRFGKPTFLSTSTSLPEIGSTHAFYWDNFDPQYMKEIFIRNMELFNNEEQVNRKKLIDYAKNFSWEKSISEYAQLYTDIINTTN